MTDILGISDRRLELVDALRAALTAASIAGVEVCDDEPALISADRTIVVTWVSSRSDRHQWFHTYEVRIICTNRADPAAFFAGRDQLTAIAGRTLEQLDGTAGRPTIDTRTITIGAGDRAQEHPLCPVVTVVATATPTSI